MNSWWLTYSSLYLLSYDAKIYLVCNMMVLILISNIYVTILVQVSLDSTAQPPVSSENRQILSSPQAVPTVVFYRQYFFIFSVTNGKCQRFTSLDLGSEPLWCAGAIANSSPNYFSCLCGIFSCQLCFWLIQQSSCYPTVFVQHNGA